MKPLRRLDDRTADSLVRGYSVPEEPALTDFVAQLSALVPETVPTPSERLARLLEQGPPVNTNALVPNYAPTRRPGLALRRLSLGGLAFSAVLFGAASMNTLPGPAQQVVSDVVGFVTPLELPKPDAPKPAPSSGPSDSPAPVLAPRETPDPSRSAEPGPVDPTDSPSPEDSADPDATDQPTEEPTDEPTEEPSEEPVDGATAEGDPYGYETGQGWDHEDPSSSNA